MGEFVRHGFPEERESARSPAWRPRCQVGTASFIVVLLLEDVFVRRGGDTGKGLGGGA